MMLFKLSLRNLKKSLRDYVIYFVTLVIGVSIFYVFNAIDEQTVMLNVSSAAYEVIDLMTNTMSAISVLVSFILGFLIVYASNFLLKRRKKEFAVYMLLGMGKQKISMIIVIETILIGLVSLAVGLVAGMFASQGMSLLVAGMFEADMTKYTFILSWRAVAKTIVYFCIIYLVVLVLDAIVIGRAKLITLLHANSKSEKNTAKNPWICMVVFLIACVILGSAYYNVTAGIENITTENSLLMQIAKGILGTFLVFWSLSGIMVFITKKSRKFSHHGVNIFTVKELSSRINTMVFSGSIICLMLFVTICVLSSAMSVRKSINSNLLTMVPADVNFVKNAEEEGCMTTEEVFETVGVDTKMFRDVVAFQSYQSEVLTTNDILADYLKQIEADETYRQWVTERTLEVMHASDYNKVAKLYGNEQYEVAEGEYIIVCDYDAQRQLYDGALGLGTEFVLNGDTYRPKYQECKDGFVLMSSNHVNFGFVLVPDSTDLSEFTVCEDYYLANYAAKDKKEAEKIAKYIDSKKFEKLLNPASKDRAWEYVNISTKTAISAASTGLTAMIVFVGIYLGLIFMIASAAILALKELSEASDNKEKYRILRRIGVDEPMLNRSLFAQCAVFFGIPLIFAMIHSIFGIQVSNYILETFGKGGLVYSILTTAAMMLAVYGVYFVVTYMCCRKIISEA